MTLAEDTARTRRGEIDFDRWPDLVAPTTTVPQRIKARVTRQIFAAAISRIPVRVQYPDGACRGSGGSESPLMVLHRPQAFFERVGSDALIGFGESYQAGDWDSPDLQAFLTELCRELTTLVPQWMQKLRGMYVARIPHHERNTTSQTKGNIARHYDLSNDLFKAFLDESLTYSSALFESGDEPLAVAQHRKIDRLLDVANVHEGSRVLEIGTGWGELSIRAAARGAQVTSMTLSEEQLALAAERIAAAGYSDSIELQLRDYRLATGSYDAVLSIEMIEAVGHEYWSTYFSKIDEVLAPGGVAAIQAITMPHDRMLLTRGTWTWINKYIFPGGFLPSTEAIRAITAEQTTLRVSDVFSMGQHYVRTLERWDARFAQAHDEVAELGFDGVFERMWHFYLCYSAAGFAARYLDVEQIVMKRPNEEGA